AGVTRSGCAHDASLLLLCRKTSRTGFLPHPVSKERLDEAAVKPHLSFPGLTGIHG
ncbi:unnamed protein product, partial [Ranitomeya imitator]